MAGCIVNSVKGVGELFLVDMRRDGEGGHGVATATWIVGLGGMVAIVGARKGTKGELEWPV